MLYWCKATFCLYFGFLKTTQKLLKDYYFSWTLILTGPKCLYYIIHIALKVFQGCCKIWTRLLPENGPHLNILNNVNVRYSCFTWQWCRAHWSPEAEGFLRVDTTLVTGKATEPFSKHKGSSLSVLVSCPLSFIKTRTASEDVMNFQSALNTGSCFLKQWPYIPTLKTTCWT